MKTKGSKITRQKISIQEYSKLHRLIKLNHGKASYCSNPECQKKSNNFEWELKSGLKYSAHIEDYIQLCIPCHRKYDETPETGRKISKALSGRRPHHIIRPISQYDLSGELIKKFDCVTDAALETGTNRSSIYCVITGRYHHANNFIWKRD